jgi:hypothetical protein
MGCGEMTGRPAIPAALRRAVLIEAGHRCAIPTCRATQVDLAHIEPWAKVHEHVFGNLLALCPNCHRRHHSGEIDVTSLLAYKARLGRIAQQGAEASSSAAQIMVKLTDPGSSLSECVIAALGLARESGDVELEELCRNELLGYADDPALPRRRWVVGYTTSTAGGQLHPLAGALGGASGIWSHMVTSEDFVDQRVAFEQPIVQIEIAAMRERREAKPDALATITLPGSSLYADWPTELQVTCYMESMPHRRILESVRADLAGSLSRIAASNGSPRPRPRA